MGRELRARFEDQALTRAQLVERLARPSTGARTAVWLALLPAGGPIGGFFRHEHPTPW